MRAIEEYPDLLTVQDVCTILRVGRRTVYQHIGDKTLRSRKIAGKYRIPKISVINYIREINGDLCYNDSGDGSDALHQT
ncbi:MAG: helix-turn-helix domain-containing protein [Syntrophorhabdaceae bacterium]|nr:helix-turn-helix domain-containing protein [Syntrophorhabdaceae bacterium]